MNVTRRTALAACLGAAPALAVAAGSTTRDEPATKGELGLVIHSFPVHVAATRKSLKAEAFDDPLRFVKYCRSLGVRNAQVAIGTRDASYVKQLRDELEAGSMHLEGTIMLPRDQADVDRFAAEVETAKRAGVTILRTVTLSGRRYETFGELAAFRRFAEQAHHSLTLARPVAGRHGVRLAVENHKDWRADELLALLRRAGGDPLGICLDLGNSIALLEDPMDVLEALAPLAITTHFKDMAVEEHPKGFYLAEVPLGAGFLDLPRAVRRLRAVSPEIRFNLEMITRDPLDVPCLSARYWATFPELPGAVLARSLALVRDHPPGHPLPRISPLDTAARLRTEDENVQTSLSFAREHLSLA